MNEETPNVYESVYSGAQIDQGTEIALTLDEKLGGLDGIMYDTENKKFKLVSFPSSEAGKMMITNGTGGVLWVLPITYEEVT